MLTHIVIGNKLDKRKLIAKESCDFHEENKHDWIIDMAKPSIELFYSLNSIHYRNNWGWVGESDSKSPAQAIRND